MHSVLPFAATSVALALTSVTTAETHDITVTATTFEPSTLVVAPGDTVVWTLESNSARTVVSGSDCTPDGVFFAGGLPNGSEGPPNLTYTWEVPEYDSLEIPYFSIAQCGEGMTGLITIDSGGLTHRVPEDHRTIADAIEATILSKRVAEHRPVAKRSTADRGDGLENPPGGDRNHRSPTHRNPGRGGGPSNHAISRLAEPR